MIIVRKPLSIRLFLSLCGISLIMTACAGLTALFPIGIIFICAGLPLSTMFFLWAWVPETRFDAIAVTQRNLFFQTKTLTWDAVTGVLFDSYTHHSRNDNSMKERTTHRIIEIKGSRHTIRIDMRDQDTKAWRGAVMDLIRQHVPAEKIS